GARQAHLDYLRALSLDLRAARVWLYQTLLMPEVSMSFKLPGASEKAEYVHRQFERIASRYDLTNDVISLGMHRSWKWRAVEALELRAHGSYLDVCCGTGDLALVIAKRLSERGRITGVDFSANMLAVAAERGRRAARAGLAHCQLEWKQG